ncbi:MAG: DNA-binding MarR family transcriptional regulator [Candidatus Pelagisphaera sp.]|jgi:DNA-binding MarR family transcriptional regulator
MNQFRLEEKRGQRRRRSGEGGANSRFVSVGPGILERRNGIHDANFALFSLHQKDSRKTESTVTQDSPSKKSDSWTFLSNHAHVLLCLHRDADVLLREVAIEVGITERAVQKIVAELEDAKVVKRTRVGRRNHYLIRKSSKLRHNIESHRTVADLLEFAS